MRQNGRADDPGGDLFAQLDVNGIESAHESDLDHAQSRRLFEPDDLFTFSHCRRQRLLTKDRLARRDTGNDILRACVASLDAMMTPSTSRDVMSSSAGHAFAPGTRDAIIPARFRSMSATARISAPEIAAVMVST